MFSPSSSFLTMPSTASQFFTAYASITGTIMLVRSMANELIPSPVRSYLQSKFQYWFTLTPLSSSLTLVIDENSGYTRNQVYDDAETYLRTIVSPSAERLNVSKTPRQKQITVRFEKGEEISDEYDGVKLTWRLVHSEGNKNSREKQFFELTFNKKFRQKVLYSYLPWVLVKSKEIKEEEKVVKLYTRDGGAFEDDNGQHGTWGSINLDHPATFDTLAMDPEAKKVIVEDLERFVRRKDFYKKVGKAWKRGYLLYGPPGTGKSSLIAAIANYLKFDIYDLELTSLYSNSDLRSVLLSTTNRSVLVIEDIDCSAEVRDRQQYGSDSEDDSSNTKLTLSGLLNFIDGLWSSCGDERIIVFTTNHKDRLDPALLRPGRMDMHIHMSYCTTPGFKILASNYLGIDCKHQLFEEIENLIESTEVTPAEIAEELMKSDDGDVALGGLVSFLKRKNMECNESKEEEDGDKIEPVDLKRQRIDRKKNATIIARNMRRKLIRDRGRGRRR